MRCRSSIGAPGATKSFTARCSWGTSAAPWVSAHHGVLDQECAGAVYVEEGRRGHHHAGHEEKLVDVADHSHDTKPDVGPVWWDPAGVVLVGSNGL